MDVPTGGCEGDANSVNVKAAQWVIRTGSTWKVWNRMDQVNGRVSTGHPIVLANIAGANSILKGH